MRTPTTGYARPDELNVDHSYQRPLNAGRMSRGLHPFNPAAVGTLTVSRRADGTLWLVDGQHRSEKARLSGHGRTQFPVLVYEGLSVPEEAALFRLLNDFKQVQTLDRFKARVTEGDKAALALTEIATKHGWRISAGTSGMLSAVGSLEFVYSGAGIRKEGEQAEVVDRTIEILTEAFGHSPHGVKAPLIQGVGLLIMRHGDSIETPKLAAEMGKIEGGALGLIASAKSMKKIRGGNLAHSMAEILVELHNKGRRTRLLPQWTRVDQVEA